MAGSLRTGRQGATDRSALSICSGDHVVGRYKLVATLGVGGMAVVYLAVLEGIADFSKLVVLKVLSTFSEVEARGRAMFLDEARLSAMLNHPSIVQIYEVGESDDCYYIAMEYLQGQPLPRLLPSDERGSPLPLSMRLQIVAEACGGLHYAHQAADVDGKPLRLIHRDVSPHNIMVTYNGEVKVLDFGIAKWADSRSDTTSRGIVKGKPGYMAPEYMLGLAPDHRIDIYSMGVVLWEALTGRRMWAGERASRIFERVVLEEPPSPSSMVAGLPQKLDLVCARALERHPEDRYETAAELQASLEEVIRDLGEDVSPRAIGARLAEAFEEERAETRRLIGERLRSLRESTTTVSSVPPRHSRVRLSGTDITVAEKSPLTRAQVENAQATGNAGMTSKLAVSDSQSVRRRNLLIFAIPLCVVLLGMITWAVQRRPMFDVAPVQRAGSAAASASVPVSAASFASSAACAVDPAVSASHVPTSTEVPAATIGPRAK